jgi:HEPN domain-containing protein
MSDIDNDVANHRRREAERWLRLAGEDARVARLCLAAEPTALASAAFHTQQAAEKVLKGLLVLAEIRFGKTHDLDRLTALAGPAFPDLAPLLEAVRPLTIWGTAFRYPSPGDVEEAPPEAAEQNMALATVDRLAEALRKATATEQTR